ncbi:peptide deformylase [Chryseobacterium indologenes]|uniref:peptide deformylase n=1 Tax=Chryseobacterium indologenes TaxID=253 RepID=UPI001D0CF6CF|nr:peptide deformylase [Chryseobacterium indologenes]UDQ53275.1 peptide deformylase [Chryseobacterium indologenes]
MKKISILFIFYIGLFNAQNFTSHELSIINQGDVHSALPIYQTTDANQHKTLLNFSSEANPTDANTVVLVKRMKESLLSTDGGVGIAAPQVGINRKVIWVQRFDKEGAPLEYFINPVIVWKSDLQNLGPEGDLSIPDFRDQFYRSKVIQLEYVDLKGQKYSEIVEGFTAVIFQHEIDHFLEYSFPIKKKKRKTIPIRKSMLTRRVISTKDKTETTSKYQVIHQRSSMNRDPSNRYID